MTLGQIYYIWDVKNLLSLTLLVLFLFNAIGYYPVFLLVTTDNRQEMYEKLEGTDEVQELRIHRSELAGVKIEDDGRELVYLGEMYDVKSQTTDGDDVIFQCIQDRHETQLVAGLHEHTKSHLDSSAPKKKTRNIAKKPTQDFCPSTNQPFYSPNINFGLADYSVNFTSFQPTPVPPPPPQVHFC